MVIVMVGVVKATVMPIREKLVILVILLVLYVHVMMVELVLVIKLVELLVTLMEIVQFPMDVVMSLEGLHAQALNGRTTQLIPALLDAIVLVHQLVIIMKALPHKTKTHVNNVAIQAIGILPNGLAIQSNIVVVMVMITTIQEFVGQVFVKMILTIKVVAMHLQTVFIQVSVM
jgi:hypothetical protein